MAGSAAASTGSLVAITSRVCADVLVFGKITSAELVTDGGSADPIAAPTISPIPTAAPTTALCLRVNSKTRRRFRDGWLTMEPPPDCPAVRRG